MSLEIKKSTQFKINELVIVTKAGNLDISAIYEEINIFDSLLVPVMSGYVLVKDSIGLSGKLLFDGSESILIDIAKDKNSDIAGIKKAFRIYKQADRKNDGMNNEMYVLHFVSDEQIYSDQQLIQQSYEGTYSQVVEKILTNYLKVSPNNLGGVYDVSSGLRSIVIPNLKPLDAIDWCAKRAVDVDQSPCFMFFQNALGYNFATLSNLLSEEEILDVKFEMKNQSKGTAFDEISTARAYEVVAQTDSVEKTKSGVNAGQFVGFDPMTGTIAKKNISFGDHFANMKHGNDKPNYSSVTNRDGKDASQAFDSKKTVSIFSAAKQLSNYIKKNDPTSLSKQDNFETYLFQRKAIIANLMAKRIKIAMPGNFQLTSGFNVNVIAPDFGQKEKGGENSDPSLGGKYLIIATRHVIGYEKHETVIEVASSSTNNEYIASSNPAQTQEILDY
jgi:hypothetical protein